MIVMCNSTSRFRFRFLHLPFPMPMDFISIDTYTHTLSTQSDRQMNGRCRSGIRDTYSRLRIDDKGSSTFCIRRRCYSTLHPYYPLSNNPIPTVFLALTSYFSVFLSRSQKPTSQQQYLSITHQFLFSTDCSKQPYRHRHDTET